MRVSPITGRIVAQLRRERETALQGCDPTQRPSIDQPVAKWQLPRSVDRARVADIRRRRTIVESGIARVRDERRVFAEIAFQAEPSSRLLAKVENAAQLQPVR